MDWASLRLDWGSQEGKAGHGRVFGQRGMEEDRVGQFGDLRSRVLISRRGEKHDPDLSGHLRSARLGGTEHGIMAVAEKADVEIVGGNADGLRNSCFEVP